MPITSYPPPARDSSMASTTTTTAPATRSATMAARRRGSIAPHAISTASDGTSATADRCRQIPAQHATTTGSSEPRPFRNANAVSR